MNNKFRIMDFFVRTIFIFLLSGVLMAETGYVTDMLQLDLYADESMAGQPVKKLRSGDSFEVLQRKGRTTNVKLADGRTGWIKSLYMVTEEPARTRMNKLEKQKAELSAALEGARKKLAVSDSRISKLENNRGTEARQVEKLETELAALRRRNTALESTLGSYGSSVPLSWLVVVSLLALVSGGAAGWYFIDARSRAKHGGYRIY